MAKISESIPKLSVEKFATTLRADFRFAPLNIFLLLALVLIGLIVDLTAHGMRLEAIVLMAALGVALAGTLRVAQVWEAAVIGATAAALITYLVMRETAGAGGPSQSGILIAAVVIAPLLTPMIQIAYQWERAVVLRLGKFRGICGPGVFVILPVIDKVAEFVDQRIRVTDFRAETTLTRDTVPVNVDAIAFWMVWNAEKAVLEVEQFAEAVNLSAQTALRNAIGKHELADMLAERDKLGAEIQQVLDKKTNDWGITVQSVEIRDITIPKGLEDAMSRQAQAERERQSRIILGTAETEISEKFATAAEAYRDNPVALHLRAMNMVFEGLKAKGSMVIVPSTAVDSMNLGAIGGIAGLAKALETESARSRPEAGPKPSLPRSHDESGEEA